MIEIASIDSNSRQIDIFDAQGVQFSNHYGEQGGGFGYLKFYVERPVGTAYPEFNFGRKLIIRKSINTYLFVGQIRQTEETSSKGKNKIEVTALGFGIISGDDELVRHFCDKRLNLWNTPSEVPKGLYRPDQFGTGSNSIGLFMHASTEEAEVNAYTELEYEFTGELYDDSAELAERIKMDLSLSLGGGIIFDGQIDWLLQPPSSDFSVTITDNLESLSTSMQSGELYAANGSAVPSVGDVWQVTGTGDFTGDNMETQKAGWGPPVATDLFEVTNNSPGTEAFLYRGRVGYSYVGYKNFSGEDNAAITMLLYNDTQSASVSISLANTTNDAFEVTTSTSSWAVDDELVIYGPPFSAQISNIAAAVITYTGDVGESNLAAGQMLVNTSQKAVATIQSNVVGSDTITVDDENDITGWAINDEIMTGSSMFSALINGTPSGTTIIYDTDIGERVASQATGWVLYNVTQDDFATVDTWTIASKQVDVTDSGDISAWVNNDELAIYAAYSVEILDDNEATVWPTDWREGAIAQNRTAINETTSASPTKLRLKFKAYLGGTGLESMFAQMSNLKAYSTTDTITATMLAEYVVTQLSQSGHDLSSSTTSIETISYEIEPMVHEFVTPKDALSDACGYGDGSYNKLAWGVKLDDTQAIYLETQDPDTVVYQIRRTAPIEASTGGDIQEAYQKVRGKYTDKLGDETLTDWFSDTDAYFNGYYRAITIQLDNIDTEAEAEYVVQKYLLENKYAKTASQYSAEDGAIFTPSGVDVSFDEVKATGQAIEIEDWRAVQSGASGTDLGSYWAREQLVAVEVDYGAKSVKLTPGSAKKTFEVYMQNLARLAEL